MKASFGIAAFCLVFGAAWASAGNYIYMEDYVTLKYADLVIEGEVMSVETVKVSARAFYGGVIEDLPAPVKLVTVRIDDVLRGQWGDRSIACYVSGSSNAMQNYSPGQVVVLSLIQRRNFGGSYQVWGDDGRFIWDGEHWICQRALPEAKVLTDEELRNVISQTKIESVRREADLIVDGEVSDIREYPLTGDDGSTSIIREILLRTDTVYKGNPEGKNISILLVQSGYYTPKWRRALPSNQEIGQRWLAFLKRVDGKYYPFAGPNGFFQVEGTQLIYDARRPYIMDAVTLKKSLLEANK